MADGPWKTEYHVECGGETDYFRDDQRAEAISKAEALKAEFPDATVTVSRVSYFSTEYEQIWPDEDAELRP